MPEKHKIIFPRDVDKGKNRLNVMGYPKSHSRVEHWLKLCIKWKTCRRHRHMHLHMCVYAHTHSLYTYLCSTCCF